MLTQFLVAISPVFFVLIGLGLIVGALSRRKAFRYVGGFILFLLLAPVRNQILRMLPLWLWLPVMAILATRGLMSALSLLFGRRVAEHAVGALLADALAGMLRAAAWILVLPFRAILSGIRTRT